MTRALVVGWDGATWSIADPMAREGRLPVLSELRSGGAEGILQSTPNMNSAPSWSTIATGLNPGRHGIFYFDEPVPDTYRRRIINAERRSGATLWRMASDAGKRVLVVNVPISYPAEGVNGCLVSGLDTPSKSLSGFSHPKGLPSRYPDLFRDYVIEPGTKSLMEAGRSDEAASELMRAIHGWSALTERLMRDEDWDLCFVVFTSSDTAQHFFWSGQGRQLVERVYELQDEATGRLVATAREHDPDVNVLVLADHGGAANTRGPEMMPVWLEDQGLQLRTSPSIPSRAMKAGFGLLNRKLTRERKQALARLFPGLRERAESESRLAGIDWGRTRAYSDGVRDEVFLNVAGRDPAGTVPSAGVGEFVEDLSARIASIKEINTGRPVVDSVTHRDDAYWGPFVDRAPDLTIRWNLEEDRPFLGFECKSPEARDRMRAIAAGPPAQSGGHHPEGIYVASGPNIRPADVKGGLADVTPTLLALLGVAVPKGLDGQPLDHLKDVEVELSTESPDESSFMESPSGYSPEEEEAVRRRLEDLGYL